MKLGDENVETGVEVNQSVPEIQNQSVMYRLHVPYQGGSALLLM